jgi:hypothetical protein
VDYFDPNYCHGYFIIILVCLGLLPGIRASNEVSKEVAKIHKFRLVISFLFML